MHLLSTRSIFLKEFPDPLRTPPYAILSHRWINSESETTFQDIVNGRPLSDKLLNAREQARGDGYDWIWVDTCCIDKTSSATLSEAINSMYAWYGKSDVCYAYLNDVPNPKEDDPNSAASLFRASKWFMRGWTLQELIAPIKVVFLAQDWKDLGTKESLADVIEEVTKVPSGVLLHKSNPANFSIAQRFSWAAHRETTKDEDEAYSLMGLFGIHMATMYGEGKQAFIRLQRKIMKHSNDQSLFVWRKSPDLPSWQGVLAPSPSYFHSSDTIAQMQHERYNQLFSIPQSHYSMTNYGIRISLPLRRSRTNPQVYWAALACRSGSQIATIPLVFISPSLFVKESTSFELMDTSSTKGFEVQDIYLRPHPVVTYTPDLLLARKNMTSEFYIEIGMLTFAKLELRSLAPPRMWAEEAGGLRLTLDGFRESRRGTAVFQRRTTGELFAIVLGADKTAESLRNDNAREVWVDIVVGGFPAGLDARAIQEKYQDAKTRPLRRKSASIVIGSITIQLTTRRVEHGESLRNLVEIDVKEGNAIASPLKPSRRKRLIRTLRGVGLFAKAKGRKTKRKKKEAGLDKSMELSIQDAQSESKTLTLVR